MDRAEMYSGLLELERWSNMFVKGECRDVVVDAFCNHAQEFYRTRAMISLARLATDIIHTLETVHDRVGVYTVGGKH